MLKKFKVKGFKNFKDEIEFDLTAGGYDFNQEAVKDGIVKNAVIYGPNGCGKSNLGNAIFDIVMTLTDKEQKDIRYRDYYFNLDIEENRAFFSYEFEFGGVNVKYFYEKSSLDTIVKEKFCVDDEVVIEYDRDENFKSVKLLEITDDFVKKFNGDIPFVRYVYRNSSLSDADKKNLALKRFYNFVENMLLFRNVDYRTYVGFQNGSGNIFENIIKKQKLDEFQSFLRQFGLNYQLKPSADHKSIYCVFEHGEAPLSEIWSTGTSALTLYFHWYQYLKDVSLVFIDEFDAFYHWDVAIEVIKMLKKQNNVQAILTTHNTDNMDNDVLRPDCYYLLDKNKIKSLPNCTGKELRQVHNLQKLYVAGAFEV